MTSRQLERAAAALGKRLVLALEQVGPRPFGRIESDPVEIATVPSFSPAGEPFGPDARTGPVGPGPVHGADAR